ncbi:MAG: hypothetical protein B6I20_07465 [Bacteroidetes bacterium 4572_117]|nr:MAG: hypothetical protein B6I20_07465 [Bacteroidetes bacterium 4572_117]
MEPIILDLNKRYSFADYLTWFDDKRRELIGGFINLMSPAPSREHQKISMKLSLGFGNYLLNKKCEVYSAPFDVRLPKNGETDDDKTFNVVQPDIVVICDPKKLDNKGCLGAPDLIVEILSKSTSKTDLKDKYCLYEKSGVKEYWIAFPNEKSIHKFVLDKNKKYQLERMYVEGDKIFPSIFTDLIIDIADVFG